MLSKQTSRLEDVLDVKDLDDLRIRQGQLFVLKQLINFEKTTHNEYEQWQKELVDPHAYD
jgi:hypothetical protein